MLSAICTLPSAFSNQYPYNEIIQNTCQTPNEIYVFLPCLNSFSMERQYPLQKKNYFQSRDLIHNKTQTLFLKVYKTSKHKKESISTTAECSFFFTDWRENHTPAEILKPVLIWGISNHSLNYYHQHHHAWNNRRTYIYDTDNKQKQKTIFFHNSERTEPHFLPTKIPETETINSQKKKTQTLTSILHELHQFHNDYNTKIRLWTKESENKQIRKDRRHEIGRFLNHYHFQYPPSFLLHLEIGDDNSISEIQR